MPKRYKSQVEETGLITSDDAVGDFEIHHAPISIPRMEVTKLPAAS
jgi:hypothetical protein